MTADQAAPGANADPEFEVTVRLPGNRGSMTFLGGPAEQSLFERIDEHGGRYSTPLLRLLTRVLPRDAVVLDAGAHIGLVAHTLAHVLPDATVHAIEAVPDTADRLEQNRRRNGLENVTIHHAALLAQQGPIRMHTGDGFSAGAFVDHAAGGVSVPATTIDAWVDRQGLRRLDLIKVDVEGSEPALLDGAARTIRDLRPMLTMEVNPSALRRVANAGPRDIWDTLRANYPFIAWVGRGGALLELGSADQLMDALRARGTGDIFCGSTRPPHGGFPAFAGQVVERIPRSGTQYAIESEIRLEAQRRPPRRMHPHTAVLLPVTLTNLTQARLCSAGPHPLRVAARWWNDEGVLAVDGRRAMLSEALRSGGQETVAVELAAPDPGTYRVMVAALHEHHAWLDDLGPAAFIGFRVVVDPMEGMGGIT